MIDDWFADYDVWIFQTLLVDMISVILQFSIKIRSFMILNILKSEGVVRYSLLVELAIYLTFKQAYNGPDMMWNQLNVIHFSHRKIINLKYEIRNMYLKAKSKKKIQNIQILKMKVYALGQGKFIIENLTSFPWHFRFRRNAIVVPCKECWRKSIFVALKKN